MMGWSTVMTMELVRSGQTSEGINSGIFDGLKMGYDG